MKQKSRKKTGFLSKQTIGRTMVFSVFIFLAAMTQTSFLPAFGLMKVVPDLMITAVLGIGFFDGEKSGAVAGIGAGILAASLGGSGSVFLPLIYMPVGYFGGLLIQKFLNRNIVSWIVYVSAAVVVRELYGVLCMIASESSISLFLMLTDVIVPEGLLTVLFSFVQYPLAKLCASPFHTDKETETVSAG